MSLTWLTPGPFVIIPIRVKVYPVKNMLQVQIYKSFDILQVFSIENRISPSRFSRYPRCQKSIFNSILFSANRKHFETKPVLVEMERVETWTQCGFTDFK